MKTPTNEYVTSAQVAVQWGVHASSVPRILYRHGISGIKAGKSRQCARRFLVKDVETVERLLRRNVALPVTKEKEQS